MSAVLVYLIHLSNNWVFFFVAETEALVLQPVFTGLLFLLWIVAGFTYVLLSLVRLSLFICSYLFKYIKATFKMSNLKQRRAQAHRRANIFSFYLSKRTTWLINQEPCHSSCLAFDTFSRTQALVCDEIKPFKRTRRHHNTMR